MSNTVPAAPAAPTPEPLLDKHDLARVLGLTVRAAERLMTERIVPVVKIGRYVRVRPADLDAYLAENTRAAATR